MVFRSGREKRLWLAAGLCIALIYSSLYIARPVAEFLRERNLLRLVIVSAFVGTGALIVWRLLVLRVGWRALGTAAAIGMGTLASMLAIPMMPEERLHFLEYGLVATLVYLALLERQSRLAATAQDARDLLARLPPLATAVVFTAMVGWIDEGIQALLPNRVYDIRDVVFNATAALVCLVSIKLVAWVGQRE